MVLEEEGAEIALIEEKVEVDLLLMEVNSSYLKHLKVFLLRTIKIQPIRIKHLLMLLRLIVQLHT